MVPKRIGRYKIVEWLGQGGMSIVYLAEDTVGRKVAIKVLLPQLRFSTEIRELLQRFKREADIIAKLEHTYVVPLIDYIPGRSQPYIVMRYMPGGTLGDRLAEKRMTLMEVLPILRRIASTLDEAHKRAIIHRDLKPHNILFDSNDQAFLADFGIAKLREVTTNLTVSGDVFGSPHYMSPEQVRGEKLIDGRSDIYSLGIILYEMLTHSRPYTADDSPAVMFKHIYEPVPKLSVDQLMELGLPAEFNKILARALAKEPGDRYEKASELVDAVESLLAHLPLPSTPTISESPPKEEVQLTVASEVAPNSVSLDVPSGADPILAVTPAPSESPPKEEVQLTVASEVAPNSVSLDVPSGADPIPSLTPASSESPSKEGVQPAEASEVVQTSGPLEVPSSAAPTPSVTSASSESSSKEEVQLAEASEVAQTSGPLEVPSGDVPIQLVTPASSESHPKAEVQLAGASEVVQNSASLEVPSSADSIPSVTPISSESPPKEEQLTGASETPPSLVLPGYKDVPDNSSPTLYLAVSLAKFIDMRFYNRGLNKEEFARLSVQLRSLFKGAFWILGTVLTIWLTVWLSRVMLEGMATSTPTITTSGTLTPPIVVDTQTLTPANSPLVVTATSTLALTSTRTETVAPTLTLTRIATPTTPPPASTSTPTPPPITTPTPTPPPTTIKVPTIPTRTNTPLPPTQTDTPVPPTTEKPDPTATRTPTLTKTPVIPPTPTKTPVIPPTPTRTPVISPTTVTPSIAH